MKLGIIGCGNMAYAIAGGILKSGIINNSNIFVYDLIPAKSDSFKKEFNIKVCDNIEETVNKSEAVLIAVKPGDLEKSLKSINKLLKNKYL